MPLAIQRTAHASVSFQNLDDPATRLVTDATVEAGPAMAETDLDRAIKLVPTEVITFYAPAWALGAQVGWRHFGMVLFIVSLLLVPAILYADGRATGVKPPGPQYVVRMLAFVAWALTLGWPFNWWTFDGREALAALAVLAVPVVGALLLRPSMRAPRRAP